MASSLQIKKINNLAVAKFKGAPQIAHGPELASLAQKICTDYNAKGLSLTSLVPGTPDVSAMEIKPEQEDEIATVFGVGGLIIAVLKHMGLTDEQIKVQIQAIMSGQTTLNALYMSWLPSKPEISPYAVPAGGTPPKISAAALKHRIVLLNNQGRQVLLTQPQVAAGVKLKQLVNDIVKQYNNEGKSLSSFELTGSQIDLATVTVAQYPIVAKLCAVGLIVAVMQHMGRTPEQIAAAKTEFAQGITLNAMYEAWLASKLVADTPPVVLDTPPIVPDAPPPAVVPGDVLEPVEDIKTGIRGLVDKVPPWAWALGGAVGVLALLAAFRRRK